ncbi:MAG: PepSY domain-containing protein [Betaproteobacteria bacterium]|nr:PepSY domain-containing protein [Betaproteobacteria bacterium]
MKRTLMIPALIVAAGVATAGGLAYAKQSGTAENDAVSDLAKAKITLVQAVSAAEAQAGGRATKAELDGERGTVVFDVEVVTPDNKVFDVKVDAADGKVLSSKLDQADRGEKDEEKDED